MDVRRLIWDPWNIAHIARHDVRPPEVDDACHGPHAVRAAKHGRLMLIGQTDAGRILAVILDEEEDDAYYPITARPADRKERAIFFAEAGETPE